MEKEVRPSFVNFDGAPLDARTAWNPNDFLSGGDLIMDLGSVVRVIGVVTQGHPDSDARVTSFTVSVSNDRKKFIPVDGGKVFEVSRFHNNDHFVTRFEKGERAQFVRIEPKTWNMYIALRAGVLLLDII